MKTAKRVLAVMIAVIMIVGTCAVAASAAYTTTTENGATKITLTSNTTKTFTIDSDTVIDLNGYRLRGEDGKAAIKITAGNVTVTNGQVMAFFGKMSTLDMIQTVNDHCPPAISMTGGNLTLDGVRVIGGTIRVPTTPIDNPTLVPAGSGIMSYNGATVTLKRTSIFGDYGVNNKVRVGEPGGTVTIEDAVILAYNTAIKGDYVVADGSEEIIAADRITGVLNNGITLTDSEKEVLTNVLDQRTLIVTKTAETLTELLEEETPLVTKTEGESMAEIEVPTLDYSWQNNKGTDCSYRLVPEAIKLVDGTEAPLEPDVINTAEADLITDDSQIRYRVQFFIGEEAAPYIESLTKTGEENPLDGVLGWAGTELNSYYKAYTGKNSNGYVDTYDELIDSLADLLETFDTLLNKSPQEVLGLTDEEAAAVAQEGVTYMREMPEFQTLWRAVYDLAGKTAWAKKSTTQGYEFTQDTYEAIYGQDAGPMPTYVGTLDRVQALKDSLESILGPQLFLNTDKYDELAVWAIQTAYPELLETLDDAIEKLTALDDLLKTSPYDAIVAAAGIDSQVALLGEGIANANLIKTNLDKVLNNGDVAATIDYVNEHIDEIQGHVEKVVDVIENWRTYVTPEKFLVKDEVTGENAYVKAYSTLGPIEIEEIEGEGNLHITVSGKGTVTVAALKNTDVTNEATLPFEGIFTLTATPKANYEFLFWVNKESGGNGRILTTEPVFTMKTDLDRDIEAVFNRIDSPMAYFTNPTGDIAFSSNVVDNIAAVEDIEPYIAGYGFVDWPGATDDGVSLADATTDYATGSSAFATLNAYYGPDGAILFVRPDSTSYIVTPVFSKQGGYTATFIDGDNVWVGKGKYSDIATHTASFGDYWVIDGTDTVVCVNKTFPYQIIDNMTFRSVAGESPETVTRTTVREENGYAVFYIERSTKKAIKTVGMVYSVSNQHPTFGEEGCYLTTAKSTAQTGLYAPSIKLSNLNGRTIYGVAYIEFEDGTYYESPDAFQYPG